MNHLKSTRDKGRTGESAAAKYYESLGYEVVSNNYRFKRAEIDLIVKKESLLIFVEVKYRKNEKYGYPEEFVSDNQKQLILTAANQFIEENNWEANIRFDIIAINAEMQITHFEDAFY